MTSIKVSSPLENVSTLDACILIEESCASIYYSFAGIFTGSPKIHSLWVDMAVEEEKHADEFRAIKGIQCKTSRCSDTENELLKAILENLNSLEKSLANTTPSLSDALVMAMMLEKSVEKYHMEASKKVLDPELSRLLGAMMEFSHGHAEVLRLAADSLDFS
jgi:rubrerythrin